MKTAETVDVLGLYSSECCGEERIFDVGDTFCRCPRCQHLCIWDFDSEIIPHEAPGVGNGVSDGNQAAA